MKVAIFTDTFTPQINGVTNTLSKVLQEFKRRNIQYLIFSPQYTDNDINDSAVERSFSVKVPFYPECRLAIPHILQVEKRLLAFNPDVIQLMTEFNMGILGLRLGKKHKIPMISNYSTNFTQYFQYYKLELFRKYSWEYMRWFHNSVQFTVCPTEETKKLLKKEGINRVRIFSRGVDTEIFNTKHKSQEYRKKYNLQNKISLLYVGRVSLEKDIDILLKCNEKLYKRYGEKIALIITGDGPELKKYKEMNYKNIIFTGYMKDKELSENYASNDIFVFPSRTETFGNVALEAMASGLPVVVANAGGLKNVVTDKVNGLHFEAGDYEDMYLKIEQLIESLELRQSLIFNGQNTVKSKAWSKVINDLVEIYEEVVEMQEVEAKSSNY